MKRKGVFSLASVAAIATILAFLFGDNIVGRIMEIIPTSKKSVSTSIEEKKESDEEEPWAMLREVKLENYDTETGIATFTTLVDYLYPDSGYACLAVHSNYHEKDSWDCGSEGYKIITEGAGQEKIEFSIHIPDWRDEFGFKVYIHPYPMDEAGWDPLYISSASLFPLPDF